MDEWEIQLLLPEVNAALPPDPLRTLPPARAVHVTLNGDVMLVSTVKWSAAKDAPKRVWVDDSPATGRVRMWRGQVIVLDAVIRPEDYADSTETAEMRFRREG